MTVKWWLSEDPANPASSLEAAILGSYTELRNLIHRGLRSNPKITLPMKTTLKIWDTVNKQLIKLEEWSPTTPLWGNPCLPHFCTIPDPVAWARYGIVALGDVVSQGQLLSFDTLRRERDLPNHMFFRFLQLRHAFHSQFPSRVTLDMSVMESELRSPDAVKTLSTLYNILAALDTSGVSRLFDLWQSDILELTSDDWEEGIQQYLPLLVSAKDRFIQLKFIHRAY